MANQKASFLQCFRFKDQVHDDSVDIHIPQIVDPQYGMYVWPAAPVLAQYVWHHRSKLKGKLVLEIGSGTSLPGILASKLGADVTLTDASHLPDCLNNCMKSCEANNIKNIRVCGLTWGEFTPDVLRMKPDIIIASDCFYDTKDFENIIVTVSFLLGQNRGAEFWTTYQIRSTDRTIELLLQKWKLKCRMIPLKNFDADSHSLAGSNLPGNHAIQMLVITKVDI